MTCDQISEDLSAYLDGELPAEARTAVETHLAACPECKVLAEELKSLSGSLQALPRMAAPAGLAAAISEGVKKSPAPLLLISGSPIANASGETMQPRSMWGPVAFGIAAVLMLFALAFAVMPALSNSANPTAMREAERRRMRESDMNARQDQKFAEEKVALAPEEHRAAAAVTPAAPQAEPAADAKLKKVESLERDRGIVEKKDAPEHLEKASIGNLSAEGGGGGENKAAERNRKAPGQQGGEFKADAGNDLRAEGNALRLQQEKQADGKPAAETRSKRAAPVGEANLDDAEAVSRFGAGRKLKTEPQDPKAPPAPVTSAAPQPFAPPPGAARGPNPNNGVPAQGSARRSRPGEIEVEEDFPAKRELRKSGAEPIARGSDKAPTDGAKKGAATEQLKEYAAKDAVEKQMDRDEALGAQTTRGVRQQDAKGEGRVIGGLPTPSAPPPAPSAQPTTARSAAAPAPKPAVSDELNKISGGKPGAAQPRQELESPAAKKAQLAAAAEAKDLAGDGVAEDRKQNKELLGKAEEARANAGAALGVKPTVTLRTRDALKTFQKIDELAKQYGGKVELDGANVRAIVPLASRAAFTQKLNELQNWAAPVPAESAKRVAETVAEPKREAAQKADAADPTEVSLVVLIESLEPAAKAAPAKPAPADAAPASEKQ